MATASLLTVRAEALFVSDLRYSDPLTADVVKTAVLSSVRRYGASGCSALVAEAFRSHPETAGPRMSWVLEALRAMYPAAEGPPAPTTPPHTPSPDPIAA